MKKFVTVVLLFTMLVSLSTSALAIDTDKSVAEFDVDDNISTRVDLNNRVIKELERTPDSIEAKKDAFEEYTETKELLLALGMEQDFIDKLSDEDLEQYATSPKMVATTSYVKTDSDGDITYLDESVALRESAVVHMAQLETAEALLSGELMSTQAQKTYQDSYMRVFYLVTYLGNGKYKFSTDARWLTMPYFRGTDSLGACSQNATVLNNTRTGWYNYDIKTSTAGRITYSTGSQTISSPGNAVNGSWYGSAGYIKVPADSPPGGYGLSSYSNLKAHYEFQGYVNYPKQDSWFNSVGSYCHATFKISYTPSLTISTKGTSAAIGLSISGSTDTRSSEVEIHHIP